MAAKSSSHLVNLPPELQIEIAKHVDNTALLALRLANTELAANTFDVFPRRLSAFRRHVTTKHSLRVLRDITATPEFVRRIKTLELAAIGVDLEYDEYHNKPGTFPSESGVREPWCRRLDDAYDWQDSGILDEIFQNLANAGAGDCLVLYHSSAFLDGCLYIAPASGATDPKDAARSAPPMKFYGLRAYVESFRPWVDRSNRLDPPAANFVDGVMRILSRSNYRPEGLDLLFPSPNVRPRSRHANVTLRKSFSTAEHQGLQDFCSKLRSLRLVSNTNETLTDLPNTVTMLLGKMHNLRSLSIILTTTWVLAEIARILPPLSLQSTYIGGTFGPPDSIRFFLSHYGHTCEEVSINYSHLFDQGWTGMFHVLLHQYPLLTNIRLKSMTSIYRNG